MPLAYLLPLIILIEGFVSIAIEILTIRQLLPVVGGSVIVTSLIIGIFLLFLALGYERGGKASGNLPGILQRNFLIVATIAGIGLSYVFIEFFFLTVFAFTPNLVLPLIIYLLIILAPMIYLLGQTLPITINLAKQEGSVGKLAGRTLGLSTLGSFLGAILTTLVLMHFFGVAWTVFGVSGLLLLLAISLCQRQSLVMTYVKATAVLTLTFMLNICSEQLLFRATTNYANYRVLNHTNSTLPDSANLLMINDTPSSYHDQNGQGFEYIKLIKKHLFTDMALKNANILVLGAGGFTLSEDNQNQNHFTYVDIDNRLSQVIKPEFNKGDNDILVINDARGFLNASKDSYDAIIVDVYSDSKAIPSHLLTHEFMQTVADRLADGRYAVFNVIANPTFQDSYSKRIDNTIRSAFGSCTASPTTFKNTFANIVYICTKQQNHQDQTVYVDNLNNSTIDAFMR